MVKSSFVLRINFCVGRQFCAPKSPPSGSCKSLAASVKDDQTTTTKRLKQEIIKPFWQVIKDIETILQTDCN
jgi:hypothetical protein